MGGIVITWCPSLSALSSLTFTFYFFLWSHWAISEQNLVGMFIESSLTKFMFCVSFLLNRSTQNKRSTCVHFHIYGHKLFIVLKMNCFNAFLNSLRECFFRSMYNMFFSAIFVFDIKEVKRGRCKNWPLRFLFNFHAVFYQVFIFVSYWWAIILIFCY